MATEVSMTRAEFQERFESFKLGIALDLVTALKRRCPVDNGLLRRSIHSEVHGETIQISMLYYALFVEFGTAPHIIRPKNAKSLRWTATTTGPRGGKNKTDVFAKEVKHPGTRAQPFIRTVFRLDLPDICATNFKRHFLG